MHALRRTAAAALCVVVGVLMAGCTAAAESEPDASVDSIASPEGTESDSAPIVFAFVCATSGSDRTETYTTYSAVWEDDRTDCRAKRITGTQMSAQQQEAVTATAGSATLEQLATTCAHTTGSPWDGAITDETAAHVADGVVLYCPGHPGTDRLRDAIAAWRS